MSTQPNEKLYANTTRSPYEYIFDVAGAMLFVPRKYVQNVYGWMIKEATKHFEDKVLEYVMKERKVMPRLALRYALEKMPKELKAQAMA